MSASWRLDESLIATGDDEGTVKVRLRAGARHALTVLAMRSCAGCECHFNITAIGWLAHTMDCPMRGGGPCGSVSTPCAMGTNYRILKEKASCSRTKRLP